MTSLYSTFTTDFDEIFRGEKQLKVPYPINDIENKRLESVVKQNILKGITL